MKQEKRYTLANGVSIPALGFGTFLIPEGETSVNAVRTALETGYRHIDTAKIYRNERSVGEGIRESGVDRADIFLTSKVWNDEQGYDTTLKAFDDSLKRLGTDYLDLYLIHWHTDKSIETWKALEKIYRDGRAKAIGVCNFTIKHLEELEKHAEIMPMINQVELHPQLPQYELQDYCKKKNIQIEAWGPLMQGQIFDKPLARQIAEEYRCSVAHLAIIWQLQQGNVALVKSEKPERIRDNYHFPDITLRPEDLERMSALEGERIGMHPNKT
jgi:diketogulonate reductase-like aldo/keto reductase